MEISYPHQLNRENLPETVVAIGFFDGIHKGHQKVIQTAIDIAKRKGMKSSVITFFPHPSVILKKDQEHVHYITPLTEKKEILKQMGVDQLYIITFNEQLAKVSPQEFIDRFIIGLNIRHLVAGFDFSYGYKGEGSMETMETHSRGEFDYTTISKLSADERKISSTYIRELLAKGEVSKVNQLLGRALTIRGTVVEGDKRGRTIGFPTANLQIMDDYLLPKIGVYAVTGIHNGKKWNGMANLGYKPTFNSEMTKPSIEVFIFDYNNDLYGQELMIEWKKFIREEKRFNGVDELIQQLKNDEQEIRSFFESS